MKRIVLTGAATAPGGVFVKRDQLVNQCRAAGIWVQRDVMHNTDAVVASRTDTHKARAAAARKIAPITYADLFRELEARGAWPA